MKNKATGCNKSYIQELKTKQIKKYSSNNFTSLFF